MIRRAIIMKEFRRIAWNRSFILWTIATPLVIIGYFLFVLGFGAALTVISKRDALYALVDQSGVLSSAFADFPSSGLYTYEGHDDFADLKLRFSVHPSAETAIAQLRAGEVWVVLVIPPDFPQHGAIDIIERADSSLEKAGVPRGFLTLLRDAISSTTTLPPGLKDVLYDGFIVHTKRLSADNTITPQESFDDGAIAGAAGLVRRAGKYLPVAVLLVVLFNSFSFFIISMVNESKSKLIDVLLCSVQAEELIVGKVIGTIAAVLLRMVIWLLLTAALPLIVTSVTTLTCAGDSCSAPLSLEHNYLRLLLSMAIVLVGMVGYGILVTTALCVSDDMSDPTATTKPWRLFLILLIQAIFGGLLVADESVWRLCSWIPVLTPLLTPVLLLEESYPLWLGLLLAGWLTLWVYALLRLSGHMLRLNVMLQGQDVPFLTYLRMIVTGQTTVWRSLDRRGG